MWNIIKSLIFGFGYKIKKDENNIKIISPSNIKASIVSSSVSILGHILIKRILGTSIYGCIALVFLDKLNQYYKYDFMKPIIDVIVNNKISENDINIPINNIEGLNNIDGLAETLISATTIKSESIQASIDLIKNETINNIPINQEYIETEYIEYGITGTIYATSFILILIVTGPAGALGTATGLTVAKISSIGLGYITSSAAITSVLSKSLGVISGIYAHHQIKKYINDTNQENEDNET